MLKRQENSIRQVIRLRARVDEAKRQVEAGIYNAVRVQGVPVKVLAHELGMTKSRIYQILNTVKERNT